MLRSRSIFAWSVHALTAAGGAVGLLTLVALEARDFPLAVLLSMLALVIDSVDGSLARWADVKNEAPGLDGRRLDDIVDYLNYAAVPAFFMLASGRLDSLFWACLVVLSSAYGFSRSDAKTADHFFLGFPSYWNVLAIYLWWYAVPPWIGAYCVVFLAIAVFPPLRFVYPSRMSRLRGLTCGLGAVWIAAISLSMLLPRGAWTEALVLGSLGYPIYYTAISIWLGGWFRRSA